MISVRRPQLNANDTTGLRRYQTEVDTAVTPAPVVDKEWRNFLRTKLKVRIESQLRGMSQHRCVYCECNHGATIDHFHPKRRFVARAFIWANFNWACPECNLDKGTSFPEDRTGQPLLLNPTDNSGEVAEYFIVAMDTGFVVPNPLLAAADQARARTTIETLKLNRGALQDDRRKYAEQVDRAFRAHAQHNSGTTEQLVLTFVKAGNFRALVRQYVRSHNPLIRPVVDTCLKQSVAIASEVRSLGWWP